MQRAFAAVDLRPQFKSRGDRAVRSMALRNFDAKEVCAGTEQAGGQVDRQFARSLGCRDRAFQHEAVVHKHPQPRIFRGDEHGGFVADRQRRAALGLDSGQIDVPGARVHLAAQAQDRKGEDRALRGRSLFNRVGGFNLRRRGLNRRRRRRRNDGHRVGRRDGGVWRRRLLGRHAERTGIRRAGRNDGHRVGRRGGVAGRRRLLGRHAERTGIRRGVGKANE